MKRPLLIAAIVTLAFDQLSKYWLLYEVGMVQRPPIVVTEWFSLVMVWNHGVSFGMFSNPDSRVSAYFLVALALVISGLLVRAAYQTTRRLEVIAYGMIIGGALGNAIDRVRLGAVADFFYFHLGQLGYPAFNIADSAICIGVGFLLLSMFKNSKVGA
jgi:signal peptidase II